MSDFEIRPQITKGALVTFDSGSAAASPTVVSFQFNPATLSRSLRPAIQRDPTSAELQYLATPPEESIQLLVELSAAGRSAAGVAAIAPPGLHAELAALETLLYPSSELVTQLNASRQSLLLPGQPPLTLFVWGGLRVMPVRLTGMSITEQEFDAQLNPVYAQVGLELQVLTYRELGLESDGGAISFGRHVALERAARFAQAGQSADLLVNRLGR